MIKILNANLTTSKYSVDQLEKIKNGKKEQITKLGVNIVFQLTITFSGLITFIHAIRNSIAIFR